MCFPETARECRRARGGLSEQDAGLRRVARREDQPHAQPRDLKAARQVAEEVQHDVCDLPNGRPPFARENLPPAGSSSPFCPFRPLSCSFLRFRWRGRGQRGTRTGPYTASSVMSPDTPTNSSRARMFSSASSASASRSTTPPEHAQQYDKHSQHGLLLFRPQQRRRVGRRRVGIELELLVFRERGQSRQVIQTLERERLQKPLGRAVEDGSARDLEPPGLLDELLFPQGPRACRPSPRRAAGR